MKSCCRNIDVIEYTRDMHYARGNDMYRNKTDSLEQDLKSANRYTKELSFSGKMTRGKVVCIYGKCMIDIVFPIVGSGSNKLYKWTCVLNESSKYHLLDDKVDEVNKILENKLLNKLVNIKCCDFNDYGILQVKIFVNCVDVIEYVIASGYCFNVGERRVGNANKIRDEDIPSLFGHDVECEVVI